MSVNAGSFRLKDKRKVGVLGAPAKGARSGSPCHFHRTNIPLAQPPRPSISEAGPARWAQRLGTVKKTKRGTDRSAEARCTALLLKKDGLTECVVKLPHAVAAANVDSRD